MRTKDKRKESPEPDPDNAVYSLGTASRLSEIPTHSIRQYIDKGLLVPFTLDSGRHLFSPLDVCRLKNIQLLIRSRGLNFAGIKALMAMSPCWSVKSCSRKDRQLCEAYYDELNPCWLSTEKGITCRNENCRECPVYQNLNYTTDFKSMLRGH